MFMVIACFLVYDFDSASENPGGAFVALGKLMNTNLKAAVCNNDRVLNRWVNGEVTMCLTWVLK